MRLAQHVLEFLNRCLDGVLLLSNRAHFTLIHENFLMRITKFPLGIEFITGGVKDKQMIIFGGEEYL